MDNGSSYTVDFIVNNIELIELKPYNFIYKQGGLIQEKFEYKNQQAQKYCNKNGLIFKVIFDKDINFSYKKLIHDLKEQNKLQQYNIEFLEPERIWSKK